MHVITLSDRQFRARTWRSLLAALAIFWALVCCHFIK